MFTRKGHLVLLLEWIRLLFIPARCGAWESESERHSTCYLFDNLLVLFRIRDRG